MSDKRHVTALGNYRFAIDKNEFDNLQRRITYRWSKSNIIGSRPNYQLSGTDEESITINGAVFNFQQNQGTFDSPVTATGTDQISQLRAEAQRGTPLRMALDTGDNMGYWVVKGIDEQQNNFVGSAPLKQAYNIRLAYFGATL